MTKKNGLLSGGGGGSDDDGGGIIGDSDVMVVASIGGSYKLFG